MKIDLLAKFSVINQEVAFFFKQRGGKNKKTNERLLNGKTYDEMPEIELQLSV